MSLLDPARLPPLLEEVAPYFNVESVVQVDSTNDALSRQLARQSGRPLPSGSVLVADQQTAGKGRQGRNWASDPAASLTFSAYRYFDLSPMQMSGLSLAVGLGIYRGLCAVGAKGVFLKWPNDLVCLQNAGQWAKLAGILIELSPSRQGVEAIIGIGVNLQPVDVPGVEVAGLSACLPNGADIDRHQVLAALLKALHYVLNDFAASGLTALREPWLCAHAWQGQWVKAVQAGQPVLSGRCLGINNEGALLLETDNGVEMVHVGDVSLRPLEAT